MNKPDRRIRRREFLLLTASPLMWRGSRPHTGVCVCGVRCSRPHLFGEAGGQRDFCGNCGRELATKKFLIKKGTWSRTADWTWTGGWNPLQVPFPNPEFVDNGKKPRILMSTIRL